MLSKYIDVQAYMLYSSTCSSTLSDLLWYGVSSLYNSRCLVMFCITRYCRQQVRGAGMRDQSFTQGHEASSSQFYKIKQVLCCACAAAASISMCGICVHSVAMACR